MVEGVSSLVGEEAGHASSFLAAAVGEAWGAAASQSLGAGVRAAKQASQSAVELRLNSTRQVEEKNYHEARLEETPLSIFVTYFLV